METIDYLWVGLTGLAIGSFLNAFIYRVPRGKKIGMERSICPNCQVQLKWYHNIPLLSYLFLMGKCAYCNGSISARYPFVELLNAGFYLFFFYLYGFGLELLVYSLILSALIAVFFIDLDFQIIPDLVTLPGIVMGLAVSLVPGGVGILESSIGLIVGGGSLYLIAILGDWLFKKESMGGGDIKLAAMLGAFLGWQKVLFVFMASSVIGLVVSVVMMMFSAKLRKNRIIPFGPFLAVAAVLAILYGDTIITLYLQNFVYSH